MMKLNFLLNKIQVIIKLVQVKVGLSKWFRRDTLLNDNPFSKQKQIKDIIMLYWIVIYNLFLNSLFRDAPGVW